jgi:DNA-binding MarR family transcriptional regulator
MPESTSSDIIQDLFRLIKRYQQIKMKQEASNYGLTRSEYELLGFLQLNLEAGKDLPVSKLSSLMRITPAAVTHMVNPLEEKGFIERRAAPSDRRVVRIALTEQGAQAAESLLMTVQAQMSGLIQYLGEEDSREFLRLMTRALEYLSAQLDKPNE